MRKFVSEHQSPYLDLTTEVSDILYRGHSQFQDIIVADSKEFGRMLVLDGVFQTSIKDEFMYHESIVHIPLFLHPNPKKVLIIGGGVIPETDIPALKEAGVAEVFTPGTPTPDVGKFIKEHVKL